MSGECILVVEDNPISRQLMRAALESEDYVVVEAADAKAAKALMVLAEPDAVVLDARLPASQGGDLCAELRELAGKRSAPILAFHGFVSIAKPEPLAPGFDDELPMPLEPSSLPGLLRTHLQPLERAAGAEGQRILLVDDNPTQAKLLSIQLAAAGFRVETARDGSEALLRARECNPDAIMSDVMMPNVDGFTLCLAVRNDPALRSLPVVLFSACDDGSRELARDVGANAFVGRSSDAGTMIEALLQVLGQAPGFEPAPKHSSLPPRMANWVVEHAASSATTRARLAERFATQTVQLAVLQMIAENLATSAETGDTVNALFRQCLDACGITRGALFLIDGGGRLKSQVHVGYSVREARALEERFPESAGARRALDGEVGALDVPAEMLAGATGTAATGSGLALPLVSGGRTLGVLLVESPARSLDESAEFAFLRVVSLELAQALGLGVASATVAASKQRHRALMENANDAIFIHTPSGEILEANRHAEELLDRPRHGIVGRQLRDFVAEHGGGSPCECAGTRRFTGTIGSAGGAAIPIDGSSALFETSDGTLVACVLRDASEQRKAEAELRESERKYRDLLETSPDIYWSTDGSGQSYYVTPNVERITGFSAADLDGHPELWSERVDEKQRKEFVQGYIDAVSGEAPFNMEYRFRRKDERWIWLHGRSYFRTEAGGKRCINFVTSEITARKELEQREAARYAVTRVIADARSVTQALHGFLPAWCATLGWDVARVWLVDRDSKELRHEAGFDARSAGRKDGSRPVRPTALAQDALKTARTRWIEQRDCDDVGCGGGLAFPLLWEGNALGVVECLAAERRAADLQVEALAQDVGDQLAAVVGRRHSEAELRRVEDQLRQAQKMEAVGQLAGGIAHDFNNLLSIVLMTSSVLLDDLAAGDPRRDDVEEIKGASERAAELTRRLLTFSRRSVVEPVALDLGAIVTGMEKMLRRVLGADVELLTSCAADLGKVRADPGQIEQVLLNLSVNARDAMPNGGTLTIETSNVELDAASAAVHPGVEPGRFVALIVSDSGCGMDDAVKRRIFEPFFTTKEAGRGTGLGLATVYGIVTQAGGSISVYSEPGHGTAFKVYLPRIDAKHASRAASELDQASRGSETILVVDDEDRLRVLMSRVLKSFGYRVLEATSAEQALAIARDFGGSIDALITDVVMPKSCGPEVAQEFLKFRPEAQVLYVSGYTDHASVRNRLLEPGANLLAKPFSAVALGARVRQLFDENTQGKP